MAGSSQQAPFAYDGLDRIFHEKARLGIVSSLVGQGDGLSFSELKSLCGLTDGNLNRHLQVLEEAGYIHIEKVHQSRRLCTRCRLSSKGRARFADYLAALDQILRQATRAAERAKSPGRTVTDRAR